jgi:hypothetical protein
MFVTAAIDASENREVVTIDIPGAFLHATNNDYVVMCMSGMLAELIVKTDPKLYRKYLTDEKGKKVLYLCLQKGTIWNDEECTLILQEADIRTERDGM